MPGGILVMVNFGDRAHAQAPVLEAMADILRQSQRPTRLERSRSIDHAHELLRQAVGDGFDTVIVGGGDGTLHTVANHPLAADLTLGILPMGTVNALAVTLGLRPQDPVDALRRVLAAPVRRIDAGHVEDRRFLCFASVGFDAEVVWRTHGPLKVLLRRGAFGLHALWVGLGAARLPVFTVQPDWGESIRARQMVLSNIPIYAGGRLFEATPDNGVFEGFACNRAFLTGYLGVALRAMAGPPGTWMDRAPHVIPIRNTRRVVVESPRPARVQLDGEPWQPRHPHHLQFRIEPGSQSFLLPTP